MEKTRAEIAMDGLSNFANSFGPDNDKLISEFKRQHRTTQQSMVRSMLKLIEAVAADDYRTDDRNKQSKVICQQLLAGFDTQVPETVKGFKPSQWLSFI